jgi:hypothetical protein
VARLEAKSMRLPTLDEFAVVSKGHELRWREDIPQGFLGLLMVNGKYECPFGTGKLKLQHPLWAFFLGPPSHKELMAVRSGEVDLKVPTPQLCPQNGRPVDLVSTVHIQLDQGALPLFLSKWMMNRTVLTRAEIRDELILPQLIPIVSSWVLGKPVEQLEACKTELETSLELRLRSGLEGYGLRVNRVTVQFPV